MRGTGTHAETNRRHARNLTPLPCRRLLVAAALAAGAIALGSGTAQAQISPQMLQTANSCLASEASACDSIHGYARTACLFGNRFACLIADEVRVIRARIGTRGAIHHSVAARTDGANDADAYRYVRRYCNDPRMAPHLRALNLCG
jgi:hypothetical protein